MESMARSVGVHNDAVVTVYMPFHARFEGEYEFAWEFFIDDLKSIISRRYKSFYDEDGWADREGRIILRNSHAEVVVYEYCGLVSVNLVPRNSPHHYEPDLALGRWWCDQVADNFRKLLDDSFQTYRLVGRFSNGEAVYERAGR